MLSLAHTIISLPFGIYLHNPILIFFVAFVFHYILDAVFHWNIEPERHPNFPVILVSLDITIGLVLTWNIIGGTIINLPILAAIIGGNTPDVIQTLWFLAGKPRSNRFPFLTYFFDMHNYIQWETKNIASGLIPQLTIIFLVILLIY